MSKEKLTQQLKGQRVANNLQKSVIRMIELAIENKQYLIYLESVRDLINGAIKQIEQKEVRK
tara:strand:+ start:322 stop:507 length:186 start_codon:yes stop_codon:yes gene_type:complete